MKLSEFGVKRPVFTAMIFFCILLLGIVSFIQLPVDLMPELEFPTLSVITQYPGAASEDVEMRVTKIIEERISTINRLEELYSSTQENLSSITLRFAWGTDLNEAANDLRQQLDFASQYLPDDVEKPMIVKFDFSQMPILFFAITAEESYEDLYQIVDKKMSNELKRIPGVAMTIIVGGLQRQINVYIDQQRLEAYNLTINQVSGILAAENVTMSAGGLKSGLTDYVIRIPGEFTNVNEIKRVTVGFNNGAPVYLKDIASVEDSFKEFDSQSRVNRRPSIMMLIQKQSDANTVEVVDRIRKAMPEIHKLLPEDVKSFIIMDTSEFIRRSINNLAQTIGWALFFIILVVFFFLRDIRGSLIIATSIPFSLIIAFIFLFLIGATINMMTLSAIAIAIGMVIDMAIVVYENTYRHRTEEQESKKEAAIFGADEVGLAAMASTITTVAIFLPIIFVKGVTGIMFRELSYVVIITLFASLFTALNFTPMLASKFMKVPSEYKSQNGFIRKIKEANESIFNGLIRYYKKFLMWALDHRKSIIFGGIIIFVISLVILFVFVPTEFMPTADQGFVSGTIELSVGTRIEETDKVMERIEDIMQNSIPEAELIFARCGESQSGMSSAMGQQSGINIITVGAKLVPKNDRDRSAADITDQLRKDIEKIPGVRKIDFTERDMFSLLSGGEKPVSIDIYGDDFEATDRFAEVIKGILDKIPGLTDVSISRDKGRPELWIEIDRDKASSLGLNMYQISNTIRNNFYGTLATLYREGGDEYDTFIQLKKSDRQSIDNLKNIIVKTPMGKQISIDNIARIVEKEGPLTIQRLNQQRLVRVGGGLYGRALGQVVADIRKELRKVEIPPGIAIAVGGTAEDQQESFQWLLYALFVGVILVYMVMSSQFESLRDPFIIIFSVPFAIVGVIWALLITGKTLSLISFVGMIMLVGIVVNNAIILIDYMNILRKRGLNVRGAIEIAGPRRLRPILMTSLTTIFGLAPMAIKSGEGSEIWSPLGISVIGGLLASTLITLIFVPTLYSIFETAREKKKIKSE